MAFNLPTGATHATCLQANSVFGGKEWWIAFVPGARIGQIHLYWGKANKVNQHKIKDGTINDYARMITDKVTGKDRYQETDSWLQNKNCWHSEFKAKQQQQTAANPAPPSAPKTAANTKPEPKATPISFVIPGGLQWDC